MRIAFYLDSYEDIKGYRKIYLSYSNGSTRPYRSPVYDRYGEPLKAKPTEWIDLKTYKQGPKVGKFSVKDRPYRVRGNSPNARIINSAIDQLESEIKQKVLPELYLQNKAPTVANVRRYFKGEGKVPKDLEELKRAFVEQKRKEGVSQYTINNYKAPLAMIESLDITEETVWDIKEGLEMKGKAYSTIRQYILQGKTFVKWAQKKGYIDFFPLDIWTLPKQSKEQFALQVEDIGKLYQVSLNESLGLARDYLLMYCMTGLRYSELLSYSPQTLRVEEKVMQVVQGKSRQGATLTHSVKLNPLAWEILSKYSLDLPRGREIEYNPTLNANIKEVCKASCIDYTILLSGNTYLAYEKASTHLGRRTLVSTACTDFGIPYPDVEAITGHKSGKSQIEDYDHRARLIKGAKTMNHYYSLLRDRLPFLPN